jgi:uncharacterized protein YecE (DUF72 family)
MERDSGGYTSGMSDRLELGPILGVGQSRVLVGTCSWTDKTLVKDTTWYPRKTMSAAERLAFYAAHYPIVEADSTYYRPLSSDLAAAWAERTPDGFRMNVKAYSLMTGHPTKADTLWPDIRDALDNETRAKRNVYAHHLPADAIEEVWRRFVESLTPLVEVGRLGAVLLQYPPWFTPKNDNRHELSLARARLGAIPVCVEFRSPRWLAPDDVDRTLAFLSDHQLTLVVDAPKVSGLEPVVAATTDLAVVRFHGRADDTWKANTATAAERFKYLYDRRELRPWVSRVTELAERAGEVHVLMNNCYEDYGVRNAADFIDLFERASS